MKYLECVINSGLFKYIKKSEYIEAFEQADIIERSYAKGEIIYYEGDVVDHICIVRRGSVRAEKTYPNGDVHIAEIFEENSIFALEIAVSKRKTTPMDYLANETCRILFVSITALQQGRLRDPIRMALTEMLADDNIRMSHKIEILAERGLRNRVQVYLDILAGKAGSNQVNVRMSREQLAHYLCVNRSALSNELNKMKREGIIDFKRHQFTLLDRNPDGTPIQTGRTEE